jgi:hypothetical protein
MGAWLKAWRKRAAYERDFRERGLENVRQQIKGAMFSPEKHQAAEKWVYREDHRYQRWALIFSATAVAISASALIVTSWAAMNASKADRAWVGPTTIRLSQKPAIGKEVRFTLEYQNSGRQPALDFFYEPDSYSFNREMTRDAAARANAYIDRCKAFNPGSNKLTIFPGKGTSEVYAVPKTFVTEAVASGKEVVLINGCFVYRTLTEVHRTAFCFKYDVKNAQEDDDGKPIMTSCNYGHYAD